MLSPEARWVGRVTLIVMLGRSRTRFCCTHVACHCSCLLLPCQGKSPLANLLDCMGEETSRQGQRSEACLLQLLAMEHSRPSVSIVGRRKQGGVPAMVAVHDWEDCGFDMLLQTPSKHSKSDPEKPNAHEWFQGACRKKLQISLKADWRRQARSHPVLGVLRAGYGKTLLTSSGLHPVERCLFFSVELLKDDVLNAKIPRNSFHRPL